MELIPVGTKINFLSKAKYAFFISACMIIMAIYQWVTTGSNKYGIDFLGGHEFVVKIDASSTSDTVRAALQSGGIDNSIVQSFEIGSNEYSIRLGPEIGDSKVARSKVEEALRIGFADKSSILKSDFVGPIVGEELRKNALIALVIGLVGMLIYITFRFEISFAFGAVVALFHDVIVCVGFYLLAGHTLTMGAVAAALTIVGYSVNDTIVIFDRVREEVLKHKNYDLAKIMNESVNFTLSRTIVTSLLTFFSALALLLVGGGSISDLSLFLVVGIITGSYSTIYIASPAALFWENMRNKKQVRA